MKVIVRGNALTPSHKKALIKKLADQGANVTDISAQYLHFIDAKGPISEDDQKILEELFNYSGEFKEIDHNQQFIVVPRLGTISPWSSKASDIIRNSGANVDRAERGTAYFVKSDSNIDLQQLTDIFSDRMSETIVESIDQLQNMFAADQPKPLKTYDILEKGKQALVKANHELNTGLSDDDLEYLTEEFVEINHDPTDAEIMMYAQVNNEHCRHKIFNAKWAIDGKTQDASLFSKIKDTYHKSNKDIISAYTDNAAITRGYDSALFAPKDGVYVSTNEPVHLVTKVETHNHPTAISPDPGGATGIGGEIRDEGATGIGAKPKMGLTGFTVSNLNIPQLKQPWESKPNSPDHIVSPLGIMIEAPLGGAHYGNEFGRINLAGYFRTFEQNIDGVNWGYHKPIMLAGGLGNIRGGNTHKKQIEPGDYIIVLGGPAMLIGLGGSSSASVNSGQSDAELDFASVQRANAELERRAQEVISTCANMGDVNPIVSIHDVGAGGLSNALPELVHDAGVGAEFELRDVLNAEPGMSPLEIWCNEAQERYVLAIKDKDLASFKEICARERCTYCIVGKASEEQKLVVNDNLFGNKPVNLPMGVLFNDNRRQLLSFDRSAKKTYESDYSKLSIEESVKRVISLPSVASKKFLITIGDRSVGGLTVRDQMVGPWQVPVADVAVTSSTFGSKTGEAMAVGERTPLAIYDAPASVRMAVAEAITNIVATPIESLGKVTLSANWMAAAQQADQKECLHDAVSAVSEFCQKLGVTIPVGKDSLSMKTIWKKDGQDFSVTSPVSMIASGFAPVHDVSSVMTPQLKSGDTKLILIDLGFGKNRLGGSSLSQVYKLTDSNCPDIEPENLKNYFEIIKSLNADGKILAYHDRSDGGLIATLTEMMFAGRRGVNANLEKLPGQTLNKLFTEEIGAVIQVKSSETEGVISQIKSAVGDCVFEIGKAVDTQVITIVDRGFTYKAKRSDLEALWESGSDAIRKLRENPETVESEQKVVADDNNAGLPSKVSFEIPKPPALPGKKPKVAILREQGVNGQVEMAAAFTHAGFEAHDIHMSDLISGKKRLDDYSVLAVCGGFSYGDVLGAGAGWAKTILNNKDLKEQFKQFFERPDTLTLGVCNGCQMLSHLKSIIPGAESWPSLQQNTSEQFEARVASVKIEESKSILLGGMAGSVLPVPVAHGEGRMVFVDKTDNVSARYVDDKGKATEVYPWNPNGSNNGITAVTSTDGRATILMPHPERAFLSIQNSHNPYDSTYSPWFKLFTNAHDWVKRNVK
ncbi:phosphoribosylformylglycinamidine synthase [Candidatus Saccharibacteria bacterium RIFCSPHIGHO2_12_FULL_41_12]|nr:MAG: phosphoribosylformylglycinamidine synthase [Candidatus Saccharibacteria bacterium RIFCSPHIGHO2_12_FULL_41_12]